MLGKRLSQVQTKNPRRSERQRRILEFLQANPAAVLSTVDPNGEPHGVVIYYVINEDFSISFLTRARTRKCDNLRQNPHTMLTVFEPRSQTTAQITGIATQVMNSAEVNSVAGAILRASLGSNGAALLPINKLQAGPFTAFTITPVQIRIARYSSADTGSYDDLFESVESFNLY